MSSGRKIENESEARRCIRAAKRRGLSAGEWARAHGIDGRSLRARKINLERRTDPSRTRKRNKSVPGLKRGRALVELVPAPVAPVAAAGGRYVLEVAGARVEFDDDFSEVTLRRVLAVLRPC